MVSVLTLVFAFRSSSALASAYGMAVTGTVTITTLLFFYVVRQQGKKPLWLVLLGGGTFLLVEELYGRRPPLLRVPGTAVFLNRVKRTTPLAMRANVEHNHVLHGHVVILSINTTLVPYVGVADRVEIDDLGYTDDGIAQVTASFGYLDEMPVAGHQRAEAEPGAVS